MELGGGAVLLCYVAMAVTLLRFCEDGVPVQAEATAYLPWRAPPPPAAATANSTSTAPPPPPPPPQQQQQPQPATFPMYGVTPGSLRPQECGGRCAYRCSATAYRKPCMFFCQKCCAFCLCVPPGTYGNKQSCPCYNDWKTKRGGPKCP